MNGMDSPSGEVSIPKEKAHKFAWAAFGAFRLLLLAIPSWSSALAILSSQQWGRVVSKWQKVSIRLDVTDMPAVEAWPAPAPGCVDNNRHLAPGKRIATAVVAAATRRPLGEGAVSSSSTTITLGRCDRNDPVVVVRRVP